MKGFSLLAVFFVFAATIGGQTTDTPTLEPTTPAPTDTPTVATTLAVTTSTPTTTPVATPTVATSTPLETTTIAPATSGTATPAASETMTPTANNVTSSPTATPTIPLPTCYLPPPTSPLCGLGLKEDGKGISIYSLAPHVCLVVVGTANCSTGVWETQNKTVFQPKVDDFVQLQVANSHTTDTGIYGRWISAQDVYFRIEIANITSSWKLRNSGTWVVPFWTALVQASRGTITGIDWDDGCFACDDRQCINQTCAVSSESDCYEVNGNGTVIYAGNTNCDLSVYLGWKGSDTAGNIFTSNAKRLSAFRSYSVSRVYDTARQNAPTVDPKSACVTNKIPGCA